MATVYILHSEKLNRFYIGSCDTLEYRLGQHLNKEFTKSFTTAADDWILFFYKDELRYEQARLIEQHIKNMKSKLYVQNLKKYPEMMEKLIDRYH